MRLIQRETEDKQNKDNDITDDAHRTLFFYTVDKQQGREGKWGEKRDEEGG